jgi:hypothetical protein
VAGSVLGCLLPTVATIVLYAQYHGFESAPTLVIGFFTSVTSAVGGGLGGRIGFSQNRLADR